MDIIKGKEIVVEIARLLTPVERVRGIESISVNGVEQEVIDHSVDIAVPTKTSDLQNDSSFVNTTQLNSALSTKATTQQLENGVESAKTYADGIVNDAVDTIETQLSSKADTSAIPTKTSQLTNDSNFATQSQIPTTEQIMALTHKWGVVSQTQTWTQASDGGYDYTMSNVQYGWIPNDFIINAKVNDCNFNEASGYFEMNHLYDISYNEAVYCQREIIRNYAQYFGDSNVRTFVKMYSNSNQYIWSTLYALLKASFCEVIVISENESTSSKGISVSNDIIQSNPRLKHIYGLIDCPSSGLILTILPSLTRIRIENAYKDIIISNSPRLDIQSIIYIVQHSKKHKTPTEAYLFTLTLHATAYARCVADTTVYTWNGNTYNGIIALATAVGCSIVSA